MAASFVHPTTILVLSPEGNALSEALSDYGSFPLAGTQPLESARCKSAMTTGAGQVWRRVGAYVPARVSRNVHINPPSHAEIPPICCSQRSASLAECPGWPYTRG